MNFACHGRGFTTFLTAVFLCGPFLLRAQEIAQDNIMAPGAVVSVSQSGSTLSIRTQNAFANLTVYNAHTIRVRISDHPFAADHSYAVISAPTTSTLRWEEHAESIQIRTDSLELTVTKSPFSLSFHTPDGQLINEDEKGLNTSWQGTQVTTYKKLQPGERFIGLGEKTGNLDRAGSAYTNWNSDVYGYTASQDPLYSTLPFYIGVNGNLAYGIFLDNSYRTEFNFGASNNRFSSFSAKGGEMNYYFIYQPTVAGIIQSYSDLTGRMAMPPLWSLGYQQNRYSYYPDAEVMRIAHTLREKKIPADGITLDIHYMDHYKLFTWDPVRFPNPRSMTDQLTKMGFTTTVIVDPGIKVEKGYEAYESGLSKNIFLKYSDGQNYTGQVWPGWCHFPDFTSEKGRGWWRDEIRHYTDAGVSGIWNDMNEISTWGQKMPDNVVFDFDGHLATHLQGHNVFGLEMARSSYEGARAALNRRPFILSRSGYAGLQRYSAIWTGDNRSEDDHMLAGVRLLTSLGLSGIPFTGMDIGGFTGNASIGLYTRWIQLGAFIPYFRNHTSLNSKASEPWSYGEDVLDIARRYISLRYTMLPYIYSSFREATLDGMPVMRSLAIGYTADPLIYDPRYQNEFLFGPSLLVLPQESGSAFAKVYLPAGEWYDAYTGEKNGSGQEKNGGGQEKIIELSSVRLPVYIRAGAILPIQSLVQSTAMAPSDTLSLHIWQGAEPNAFVYYEDDGASYRYEKGEYYQRTIRYDPARRAVVLEKAEGSLGSKFRYVRLVLHGFGEAGGGVAGAGVTNVSGGIGKIGVNGKSITLSDKRESFLSAGASEPDGTSYPVKMAVFSNDNQAISVQY